MNGFLRKTNLLRLLRTIRTGPDTRGLRVTTIYAFSVASITLPSPSLQLPTKKELLDYKEVSCPIHCYHEPLHSQVERLKNEVRPKSLVQCMILAVKKIGRAFHLVVRSVQVAVIFSPVVLTCWFCFFSSLRKWWYRLFVYCLQIGGSSFMKLGQWAATRPDILPIELCKQLSTLHSSTKCLPFHCMKIVMEKELGKEVEEVFDEVIETPIGSGCIAQVYKAHLRGTDQWVALKVKRPEVDTVFSYDLQLINSVASFLSVFPFMEYLAPKKAAQMFTRTLYDQLDFRREAVNLVHFRENFRDDDQFTFPEPYLNLTTSSFLVESYEDGVPLSSYLTHPTSLNPTLAHLGTLGFLHMLLIDNFVHADLHPGNILVRENVDCQIPFTKSICHITFPPPKSHPQLVFLDTGLVNVLEESQKQNFLDIFVALSRGNGYEAGKLLVDRAPQPSPPVIDPEGFANEIRDLVNRNMDNGVFNLLKLEIANALTTMMTSSLTHHVTIDSRFINLFMSVVILEGVGRQLYKNLDIVGTALPVIMYSVPEYGEAAMSAIRESQFARKSLYVSLHSYLQEARQSFYGYIRRSKKEEPVQEEYIEPKEDVDYREATLLSLYDRVEKSQVV